MRSQDSLHCEAISVSLRERGGSWSTGIELGESTALFSLSSDGGGGEGRGEESRFYRISPLPNPARSSQGEGDRRSTFQCLIQWQWGLACGVRSPGRGPRSLSNAAAQFPVLSEETCCDDAARGAAGDRHPYVHHGVVRQLGRLARIVQVIVFAEREAAIQHDIFLRVQRIGINQNGDVIGRVISLFANRHLLRVPAEGELIGDFGEKFVARRIAPQNKIVGRDVGVGDVTVVFEARLAPKLLRPLTGGLSEF